MDIATLTDLTMEQVTERMRAVLPDEAYKALPGAAGLTDINPAFLWEVLTECFGPAGYGWFYKKGSLVTELVADGTKKNDWIRAMLDDFALFYRLVIDGEIIVCDGIESNGASENADFSYAVRGATTNALGGAARMLLWQLHVYKGQAKAPRKNPQSIRNDGKPADFVMPFGKFQGNTIAAIYANAEDNGADYLQWLAGNAFEAKNETGKRAKIAAAAYLASQIAPVAHWIDDASSRKKFWAWCKGDLKLNEDQVHQALDVEHIKDYPASKKAAQIALEAFAKEL